MKIKITKCISANCLSREDDIRSTLYLSDMLAGLIVTTNLRKSGISIEPPGDLAYSSL